MRVSDKVDSVERVFIASVLLAMGADTVITVRVFMATGPLVRGADAVVGAEVAAVAGSYDLRSVVRFYGSAV